MSGDTVIVEPGATAELSPDSEAVEAVAEAAVEIAEIEAARDVEIAEIHADEVTNLTEAIGDDFVAEVRAWLEAHGPADHAAIWAAIAELRVWMLSVQTQAAAAEATAEAAAEAVETDAAQDGQEAAETSENAGSQPLSEAESSNSGSRRRRRRFGVL